jgi:hypothetical protein
LFKGIKYYGAFYQEDKKRKSHGKEVGNKDLLKLEE